MKVIYKKNIIEKIKDVIEKSYYKNKKIEKFIFTSDEFQTICDFDDYDIVLNDGKSGYINSYYFEIKE